MTVTGCHAIEEEGEEETDIIQSLYSAREENDDFGEYEDAPVENSENERQKRKLWHGTLGEGLVMLSSEQVDDLLDRLSFDEYNKYFAIIRDCEKSGKHFRNKTHYQAILDMAEKDRRIKK
jgi:hypothetical protein